LNFEFFIFKRIILSKNSENFSKPAVKIAILSIALGLAVMIISVAIVKGFQNQVSEKVIGFGSHIRITKYDENTSFESKPIEKNQAFYPDFYHYPGIRHVQVFATKAGIVKTDEDIQGVVLKGIGSDYDWTFFNDKIIAGRALKIQDTIKSNDVLISKILATRLKLQLNDKLSMYFIQDPPRMRKFNIVGIYETGLEEFDKMYVMCDIAHVQKLNDWNNHQVAGFEILINDFDDLDQIGKYVYDQIDYTLNSQTIKQLNPQIFDWLELQNINVIIILALMVLVAGMNMISTLLILILERTNMIGILKALGTHNWSIRKIFLYNAAYLIGKGLLWGNVIGIGMCIVQKYTGFLKLSQESYYVSVIPIDFSLTNILIINLGTFGISILMLLIPSYVISKISPVKSIRFK